MTSSLKPSDELVPTKRELRRRSIIRRFDAHLRDWWPKQNARYPDRDYSLCIEDPPFQVWRCTLTQRLETTPQANEPKGYPASEPGGSGLSDSQGDRVAAEDLYVDKAVGAKQETLATEPEVLELWMVWDGHEVHSNDNEGDAYRDLIIAQKDRRAGARIKYFTSPLTVSAVLAVLLGIMIGVLLLLTKREVPKELWSVFTAVVAFYFGREGARSKSAGSDDEVLGG